MNRPGLMMNGQVVMAPGFVDTTGPQGSNFQRIMASVQVYCDGAKQNNVLAYDEEAGHVLTKSIGLDGSENEPLLQIGVVNAVPRVIG